MNSFEMWQVLLGCIQASILLATFLGAIYVGFKANEINDRMRMLQDYVAIAAVPDSSVIKLINVGKVNLYLWGFDMPGNSHHFERPRLIPSGTNDSAYYYIGTPDLNLVKDNQFDFKLYLTDQFGNKWITNAGGDVTKTKITDGLQEKEGFFLKVWAYDTSKEDWKF
ncbi:MAG: hypothetical protein WAW13_01190 [Minisyncoccia bacterium]